MLGHGNILWDVFGQTFVFLQLGPRDSIEEVYVQQAWVYFAGSARASESVTLDLVLNRNFLCRTAYNQDGNAIAHVKRVSPTDRILLCYDRVPVAWLEVDPPETLIDQLFPAITRQETDTVCSVLTAWGYKTDSVFGCFTGFNVSSLLSSALPSLLAVERLPRNGQNSIVPFGQMFGARAEIVMAILERAAAAAMEMSRAAGNYLLGDAFEQIGDLQRAVDCFRDAADGGHRGARERLERLL